MKKLFFLLFIFFPFFPFFVFAQTETGAPPVQKDEFYLGEVVIVQKEGEKFDQEIFFQDLKIQIKKGPEKGKEVTSTYEIYETKGNVDKQKLHSGSLVIVGKSSNPAEGITYYISDTYRLRSFWWVLLFFFLITVVFAKMQGVRAFLGLILSFVIIGFGIIPLLLKGYDPLLICLLGCVAIASTTLYLAHGFHARTTVAFVSILFTLALAALLSYVFVSAAHLFGLGSEEAFFLRNSVIEDINLRGLLLGGILIGTLGVLDDVTTAQSATVEEIHKANKSLGFRELYTRGLSVGREHIVSLVNTLVLAYTGASFPLLLLFTIYEKPFWTTLNSEIIMEEVVRMLVSSIALIFAVPIATFLAAFIFSRDHEKQKLDKSNSVASIKEL